MGRDSSAKLLFFYWKPVEEYCMRSSGEPQIFDVTGGIINHVYAVRVQVCNKQAQTGCGSSSFLALVYAHAKKVFFSHAPVYAFVVFV